MADASRHNAILGCVAARGRAALALHLAIHGDDLPIEAAVRILMAAPQVPDARPIDAVHGLLGTGWLRVRADADPLPTHSPTRSN